MDTDIKITAKVEKIRPVGRFCLAALVVFFCFTTAWPWGRLGHQTVAQIAEDRLSDAALNKIADILGEDVSLADVAMWADEIKWGRPKTRPWHFIDVNIHENPNPSDLSDYCPDGNCVTNQIGEWIKILKNPNNSQPQREEALKFIVHLVGDLHQPLHCSDDNDKGGNDKKVRFFKRKVKLHALWDNVIESSGTEDPVTLARKLEDKINGQEAAAWKKGNAANWAIESWSIAKDVIYPHYRDHEGEKLGKSYQNKMRPIAREQLAKAGVRLAELLEQALKD